MRLAERRGCFTRRRLSQVQEFAAQVSLVLDARDRARGFTDGLKLALISYDPKFVRHLFPDWQRDPEDTVDQGVDTMDTTGSWKFTGDVTPDMAERLLEQVHGKMRGSFSINDVESGEDGKWM